MFTTPQEVMELTGHTVENSMVYTAQSIIEMYVGKSEARVESADDRHLLGLATAYQAAYMAENYETVFEQVGAKFAGNDGFRVSLDVDRDSPFIAPLARMCTGRLSWMGTRSLTTAPLVRPRHLLHWRVD